MPHTPGDWKIQITFDAVSIVVGSEEQKVIVAQSRWRAAERLKFIQPYLSQSETIANAELMVRAPRLVRALLKAKDVIRTWHDAHGVESEAWQIYDRHAPEMREINELLSELNTAGVL